MYQSNVVPPIQVCSVGILQRQVESLTQQVATMSQSYEELIDELRERNRNGLIFLPFETLHQKILMEGTFSDGIFAQIIDHPRVTILDKFILADVFISNEKNDHYTLGLVLIKITYAYQYIGMQRF